MGRTTLFIAFLLVAVITERIGVALCYWAQQERGKGRHYAVGPVFGWRSAGGPTLYLHFRVPPTGDPLDHEVKAPRGLLSSLGDVVK